MKFRTLRNLKPSLGLVKNTMLYLFEWAPPSDKRLPKINAAYETEKSLSVMVPMQRLFERFFHKLQCVICSWISWGNSRIINVQGTRAKWWVVCGQSSLKPQLWAVWQPYISDARELRKKRPTPISLTSRRDPLGINWHTASMYLNTTTTQKKEWSKRIKESIDMRV